MNNDEKDLDTYDNFLDKLLVNQGKIRDDAGFLEDLCIAEGGLEGEMADFQENGWREWSMKKYGCDLEDAVERKIRKQVDSDLSKTRVFPLNLHIIMVKFSLKCQARILTNENRCLIGIRASEELLETVLSSTSAVPDQPPKVADCV